MRKIRISLSLFLMVVVLSGVFMMPVEAGTRVSEKNAINKEGVINEADWHSTDTNIACKNEKLVIPADTSLEETKLISKIEAEATTASELVSATANFRLTAVPEGKQFILAFGLSSIEPLSGETGNVEIVFANKNEIEISVIAYGEDGAKTIVDGVKSGVSLNGNIKFESAISNDKKITIKINNKMICDAELPVTGEGRFGIMQTGSCGAEFSDLQVKYSYYDRPENANIEEDFENGEFNANLLMACLNTANNAGIYPAGSSIEDYNGSKVLMFRNAGLGWIGTIHPFSNFELTFDIPYYLQSDLKDENGNIIATASNTPCVSFGEESARPVGEAYIYATDLLVIGTKSSWSEMQKLYNTKYESISGDPSENRGFSVKVTMVDGNMTLSRRPLSGGTWQEVTTQYYSNFRSGQVYIWCPGEGNFAIDNIKITNLDEDPNLIEVEYKSSVMKKVDYELTDEEKTMTFRKTDDTEEDMTLSSEKIFFICCLGGALLFLIVGVVVSVKKRKTDKGGAAHEEK